MLTAWRITPPQYADTAFSGIGAERYGGRFNSKGRRVVYTSGSFSLALLELLVQAGDRHRIKHYLCRSVTFREQQVEVLQAENLPAGWDARPYVKASQEVGDAWLEEARSLVLQVPSVVVPHEYNYLINPLHPEYSGLVFSDAMPVPFDPRLSG